MHKVASSPVSLRAVRRGHRKPAAKPQHPKVSARAKQARSVYAPSTAKASLGPKRKVTKVIRPRPARKRGQARQGRASSAAGKTARRTLAFGHDDARRASRATRSEARNTSGRSCSVHGAGCMPRERSKPRHAFPKGTEGIACTQACASCRNTRSLSEPSLKMAVSSARGAESRGCGCLPADGSLVPLPSRHAQNSRSARLNARTGCACSAACPHLWTSNPLGPLWKRG